MSEERIDCLCVLYIKGQPSAIIDNCGYSLNQFEPSCRLSILENNVLLMPYFPKIEKGETIRTFKLPLYYPTKELNFENVEKKLERIFIKMEFLEKSEIEQRRYVERFANFNQRETKEIQAERQKAELELRKNLYKDWWKRTESENAKLGMYNGD